MNGQLQMFILTIRGFLIASRGLKWCQHHDESSPVGGAPRGAVYATPCSRVFGGVLMQYRCYLELLHGALCSGYSGQHLLL